MASMSVPSEGEVEVGLYHLDERLQYYVRLILADAQVSGMSVDLDLTEYDTEGASSVAGLATEQAGPWLDSGTKTLVLRVAGSTEVIDESDAEHAAVAVASSVQDYIIDLSGKPWPEVLLDNHHVVLDAAISASGECGWVANSRWVCAFGGLGPFSVQSDS